MKLIDRYIGREIISATLFAVAVLTFVLVLGQLFKELLETMISRDVPVQIIISAIAYIIPFSLTYTIPWGFLTAVLLVFGRLSGENEMTAFKSSGISITRMCVPLVAISMAFTLLCLWINLYVAPTAQDKRKNMMVRIATDNPMSLFSSDHVIDEFPGKKIYVESKNGRELTNILVYEVDKDANVQRVISAKRGELETKNMEMYLHIYDARFEIHDPDAPGDIEKIHPAVIQETVFSIPLEELYERNRRMRMFSQTTPKELYQQAQVFRNWMNQGTMKPEEVKMTRLMISGIWTELSKRVAFSFASFALALMAVPLAITAHRKETSIGFLFSIMVGFGYFFFTRLADMVQLNPKMHPEILVWLPNIIFIGLGTFLFRRLARQ